jgi:hypothetical protein
MLEDPSYSEIVRWGDEGDSFVVLEVIDPSDPVLAGLLKPPTVEDYGNPIGSTWAWLISYLITVASSV